MFTIIESVRVAWLGLMGNKLRSFLTMLGVIIGVAAVIALVSVGQGAQQAATQRINALGTNLITVSTRGAGFRLEQRDLPQLRAQVPGIAYILPQANASQQTVKSESESYTVDVEGTGADYPAVRERGVILGDWFSEEDVNTRRRVAVLGTKTVEKLYGSADANPLGRTIRFLGQSFEVIGVAEPKGTGFGGQDQDDRIFVPFTTAARLLGLNRIPTLILKTQSAEVSAEVTQQVTDFYVAKFRNANSVRVQSQDQLLETVGDITRIFTLLLGAIASVSLAVGGIGIMNIMLVSVSERTREIGIRKAIGAKNRDVLAQFLVEALLLSVTGGVIGIGLGTGGAQLISRFMSAPTLITSDSVMISFAFALAIGVIFGFYPAYRAAHLDPIEALRRD